MSLGSSSVVVFIRSHRVHLGYDWVSLGSSGVVWLTLGRPGGLRVHPWSLGSLKFTLGVV